jgi:hypothetical protein
VFVTEDGFYAMDWRWIGWMVGLCLQVVGFGMHLLGKNIPNGNHEFILLPFLIPQQILCIGIQTNVTLSLTLDHPRINEPVLWVSPIDIHLRDRTR